MSPHYLGARAVNSILNVLSRAACRHPIHTICTIAILASTTYVGILKNSIFSAPSHVERAAESRSLIGGGRSLLTGPQTGWKWQSVDPNAEFPDNLSHLALMTLVFPDSSSSKTPRATSSSVIASLPDNLSVAFLPSTSNPLSAYSQYRSLVFSSQYNGAPDIVAAVQELPNHDPDLQSFQGKSVGNKHQKWVMKAARANTRRNIVQWARELCGELLDLIQSAQTLDIIIIGMGYVSMYLTFISLFLSLKRLGSRVWLATSVLLSSTFASLMALDVTVRLGVPISMRLLSEGLPFLVVIVGFEKSMSLTRAVLSHAIEHRKPQAKPTKTDDETNLTSSTIQYAVRNAIRDEGSNIVCHYAVKIALLILGAASGVQGGLNDFCFLAALILFSTVFYSLHSTPPYYPSSLRSTA